MAKHPNDYLKGNRTKGNRNSDLIKAVNDEYSKELTAYKRMAEAKRNLRVIKQEDAQTYLDRVIEYIDEKQSGGKPLTVSGVNLAMKVSSMAFRHMREGDYDYLAEEYIALNGLSEEDIEYYDGVPYHNGVLLMPYSDIIDRVYLMIQEQRETACSSLRGNPAGNIFLLKAQQGFREDSTPQTVNQTLVIADVDKAKEAMKLLGD